MHTYIRTDMHAYIHAYLHNYIHAYIHAYKNTYSTARPENDPWLKQQTHFFSTKYPQTKQNNFRAHNTRNLNPKLFEHTELRQQVGPTCSNSCFETEGEGHAHQDRPVNKDLYPKQSEYPKLKNMESPPPRKDTVTPSRPRYGLQYCEQEGGRTQLQNT